MAKTIIEFLDGSSRPVNLKQAQFIFNNLLQEHNRDHCESRTPEECFKLRYQKINASYREQWRKKGQRWVDKQIAGETKSMDRLLKSGDDNAFYNSYMVNNHKDMITEYQRQNAYQKPLSTHQYSDRYMGYGVIKVTPLLKEGEGDFLYKLFNSFSSITNTLKMYTTI